MTTITEALNAGNFSQAISLVGAIFPDNNQPLIDAITQAATDANTASVSKQAAIELAGGL